MTLIRLATAALLAVPTLAHADAPALQNTGPIIYLADNLDEADKLGYCIDTQARGQTERIQLHSCKPDTDNPMDRDVLFSLNEETGRIEHAEYEDYCLTANEAGAETALGLLECTDAAAQQFSFDADAGEIHPASDESLCLVGAAESSTAGPFMSRPLDVEACEGVDPALKTFVVQR